MSRTKLAVLGILAVGIQLTGCGGYLFKASVDVQRTADVDGVRQVVVETKNGAIEVFGEKQRSNMNVEARKYARGATQADAEAYLDRITIDVERDADRPEILRVVARFPVEGWARSSGASFKISLPPGLALDLKTSNGKIRASATEAAVEAETSNGRVELSDVKGTIQAHTSNGSVTLTDVSGEVVAKTSNGRIDLVRVSGDQIRAKTSNGKIAARDIRGNTTLVTSNSSIDLRAMSLPAKPSIKAVTSNGSVHVEVPDTVNARLGIRTSNGRIKTKLDGVKMRDLESSDRSGVGSSRLSATLNDGGGSIEIETSNGSITFETLAAAKP
jgi:DUF4097 and DUF4098 domain-containing protein YvlB